MTSFLPTPTLSRLLLVTASAVSLTACAAIQPRYPSEAPHAAQASPGGGRYKVGQPYQVGGIWYVPREQPDYDKTGIASWYGGEFHQKTTANGEMFDMNAVTAAHTTLPLPSMVEVTNLDNGRRLVVRVNDRGPFVGDRIIDLSREAARQLGYERAGLARVRVRYVGPAPLDGGGGPDRYARATRPTYPTALASAPPPPLSPRPKPQTFAAATALPPVTGAEILDTPVAAPGLNRTPPPAPVAMASLSPLAQAPAAPPPSPGTLRVQVGAFSTEAGAQRVAAQVATAGAARIEPVQRDGTWLYRVVMPAPDDEAAAYALRDRVADIGFAGAQVIRAF